MPGSTTAPGRSGARNSAPAHVAFRQRYGVGARNDVDFAAQWLAYAIPCRRFTDALADTCARLGADVVCYSFIVVDLHHLLLAGLPAHTAYDPRQNPICGCGWQEAAQKPSRWQSQERLLSGPRELFSANGRDFTPRVALHGPQANGVRQAG